MTTFSGTGTHRIIYKAGSFATGVTVTAYIWSPTLVISAMQTFTEVSVGLYYLDYNFAATGVHFGKYYEGGTATVVGTYDVVAAAPTAAEINAEIVDGLITDTYGEPATGAPPATASIEEKISWLYTYFRNKTLTTATLLTVRDDADGSDITKATMSDDGTTFTKEEFVSG